MPTNFYMYFVVALIPFVLGGIWYGPLFGKSWMNQLGFTEEYLKKGNMPVIFGLSYIFNVMFSMALGSFVIHQATLFGLFMPEVLESGSAIQQDVIALFDKYGDRHRTFSHGAVHGLILSIFMILPIIGVKALFERRSWKYILINWGYWAVATILMGGILCATLTYPEIG